MLIILKGGSGVASLDSLSSRFKKVPHIDFLELHGKQAKTSKRCIKAKFCVSAGPDFGLIRGHLGLADLIVRAQIRVEVRSRRHVR